ncbi:MAG: hypothetical protein KTR30_28930 [Saprospiraceae bacterium]|nr:hypothetical protein [Saprospiraceae bacterium]
MKTVIQLFFFLTLLTGLYSCGSSRVPTAVPSAPAADPESLSKSLFNFEGRSISEDDIARILSSDIQLPDTVRLAILNYSSSSVNRYYSSYWSNEEFLKLQQSFVDIFKQKLETNSKVKRVILMPKLMIGNNPNIFTLRESAVRLQADLFLVFSINSDIYYRYKVFKKDEAKAYATAEALLMDVRTGIIPYSEIVTHEKQVTKDNTIDLTDQDTQKRAENGAIQMTLEDLSNRLNQYLRSNL